MKLIFTAILVLASVLNLSAHKDSDKTVKEARSIIIEMTDGSQAQININSGLTLTFADGNAVIKGKNDKGEEITVATPYNQLKSFSFASYKEGEKPVDPSKPDDPSKPVDPSKPSTVKAARSIIVESNDGSTIQVNIHSGLTLIFADGNAVIQGKNDKGEEISVITPLSDLRSYSFSDKTGPELSGIENIAEDADIAPMLDGMILSGIVPGARIVVADTAGRIVATLATGVDGTVTLPFDTLPSGIYIISTPTGAIKVAL